MRKIYNADKRLVCEVDEQSDTIVIVIKGYETRIIRNANGLYEVVNTKPAT